MSDSVSETDLHAFIDGELPPERAAAVEAAMKRDAGLAERVRRFQADKIALAAAFGPWASAPIPPALLAAARDEPRRPTAARRTRYFALVASGLIAASLVLAVVGRSTHDPAVTQALAAREDARQAAHRLTGNDPATLDAANTAMSDMLGMPVRVPDLQRAGFTLVSTDIYGGSRSDAVQLRYEDHARRLFTVYLRPSEGKDSFELTERGSIRICIWRNADVTAIMAGEMSTSELFRLASLTYTSLGL